MPSMPKADEGTKAFFRSVVPNRPDVTVRPMFGNLAAFVNGNMFMGLFGSELFLRLDEPDLGKLADAGGGPFEPMPGRPMRGYAVVPAAWRDDARSLDEWIGRSLSFSSKLPPKAAKTPKAARKR